MSYPIENKTFDKNTINESVSEGPISSIPDEILQVILGNLDMIDSQRTSLVSSRMKNATLSTWVQRNSIQIEIQLKHLINNLNKDLYDKQLDQLQQMLKDSKNRSILNLVDILRSGETFRGKLLTVLKEIANEDLNKLLESTKENLAFHYVNVFIIKVVPLYKKLDQLKTQPDSQNKWAELARVAVDLAELYFFEKAMEVTNLITNLDYQRSSRVQCVIEMINQGHFRKDVEDALDTISDDAPNINFKRNSKSSLTYTRSYALYIYCQRLLKSEKEEHIGKIFDLTKHISDFNYKGQILHDIHSSVFHKFPNKANEALSLLEKHVNNEKLCNLFEEMMASESKWSNPHPWDLLTQYLADWGFIEKALESLVKIKIPSDEVFQSICDSIINTKKENIDKDLELSNLMQKYPQRTHSGVIKTAIIQNDYESGVTVDDALIDKAFKLANTFEYSDDFFDRFLVYVALMLFKIGLTPEDAIKKMRAECKQHPDQVHDSILFSIAMALKKNNKLDEAKIFAEQINASWFKEKVLTQLTTKE